MMAAWDEEQLLLTDVVRFVESDAAPMLAVTAREFGIDPAEGVDDPWLAIQLRVGLLAALRHQERKNAEEPEVPSWKNPVFDEHRQRMDNARRVLTGK